MKINQKKTSAVLMIVVGLLASLCIVVFGVPTIGKWRDKTYFFNHRQAFEELVDQAAYSDCEGRCIEALPESAQMNLKHKNNSWWLLCYTGEQLSFVSLSTPSDNYYVYAAAPTEFPHSPTCGYGFIGLERLDNHWYFAKVVVYN
jgi:hypothetical protein